MSETEVDSSQIVFRSAKTSSTYDLQAYIDACERTGRTLPGMFADLFKTDGNFNEQLFQFRDNPALHGDIQVRIGVFTDPDAGWYSIPGTSYADILASAQASATTATNASNSATATLASVNSIASQVAAMTATSTTSQSISVASKVFTTQSGKDIGVGRHVLITSNADAANRRMSGIVTAYSGTSLTVNVESITGSGTFTDWTIRIDGERGPQGPQGATGPAGSGAGDMFASQNLNDVTSKPTAFANIKQAATDTATGVVELATNAETVTGTDTTRAVTPAGVAAVIATLSNASAGRLIDAQYFSASGTWNKPVGTNAVLVFVTAGGGSGATAVTQNGTNGATGSSSSFGAHCSAAGGQGGTAINVGKRGLGGNGAGTATGGLINLTGGDGHNGLWLDTGGSVYMTMGGNGGASYWGGGSRGAANISNTSVDAPNASCPGSGGGGNGIASNNNGNGGSCGGGGQAGGTAIKFITSGLGATESVTIGTGGTAQGTSGRRSGAGADGCCLVLSFS